MQRILLSALVVGGVVGAAIYGTSSFFSDSETSTGNTFTAGSIDLTIDSIEVDYNGEGAGPVINDDGVNNNGFYFTIDDIKPLDDGTITYNLTNGSNEAYVCALVTDATPTPAANDSALANMMNFLFGSDSGTVAAVAGQWQQLPTMGPNTSSGLSVDYCFGVYDGTTCVLDDIDYNPAQEGQMVVDLEFYAEQTRNNPNFTCDSLNEEQPTWVETTQASGSALIVPVIGGPLGDTALQLTTINDVSSRVRYTYSPLNINLADFTSFSYDSNQVSAFDQVNGNASFRLVVDLD
jgi:predicted ribosomally synthesized peptide with SipW-like signal peptide